MSNATPKPGDIVRVKVQTERAGFVLKTRADRVGTDVLVDWEHAECSWIGLEALDIIGTHDDDGRLQ